MTPNAETEDIITMTSEVSEVHSLKAAIFHTMALIFPLNSTRTR